MGPWQGFPCPGYQGSTALYVIFNRNPDFIMLYEKTTVDLNSVHSYLSGSAFRRHYSETSVY